MTGGCRGLRTGLLSVGLFVRFGISGAIGGMALSDVSLTGVAVALICDCDEPCICTGANMVKSFKWDGMLPGGDSPPSPPELVESFVLNVPDIKLTFCCD